MASTVSAHASAPAQKLRMLRNLYFVRAVFSILWVTALFLVGIPTPQIGAFLLVIYPAWDAIATLIDIRAQRDAHVQTAQYLNVVSSTLATVALGIALNSNLSRMIIIFGIWALLAGLIQLFVGLNRRRELGGQWAMIVSGAQSGIAGVAFIIMANMPSMGLSSLAGYSAFGACYFLISAIRLTLHPDVPQQSDQAT